MYLCECVSVCICVSVHICVSVCAPRSSSKDISDCCNEEKTGNFWRENLFLLKYKQLIYDYESYIYLSFFFCGLLCCFCFDFFSHLNCFIMYFLLLRPCLFVLFEILAVMLSFGGYVII